MLKTKNDCIETIKRYYGLTRREALNYYNMMSDDERATMIEYMQEYFKRQARLSFYND